jgi:hypothetical protein
VGVAGQDDIARLQKLGPSSDFFKAVEELEKLENKLADLVSK